MKRRLMNEEDKQLASAIEANGRQLGFGRGLGRYECQLFGWAVCWDLAGHLFPPFGAASHM